MTVATARNPGRTLTAYRIEVLARDDDDRLAWRWCGEHLSDSRTARALDEWLFENEPPAGQYRATAIEKGWTAEIAYGGRLAA